MSKIIEKKLQQIKDFLEQLTSINQTIESHINILNDMKKEYNHLTIKATKNELLNYEVNIYHYNELALYINVNHKEYHFSFFGEALSHFNTLYSNTINPEITSLIKKLQSLIDIKNIQRLVYNSNGLFNNIKNIYKEIDFQNSDFTKNSDTIASFFKTLVKQQNIEKNNDLKYGYIKLKKDNKLKFIKVSYKDTFVPLYIQIKLPIHDNILTLLKERNQRNQSSKFHYEIIFREEVLRLNQEIFNKLNISMNSIFFYIQSKKETHYVNFNYYDFEYDFYIKSFNEEEINLLAEKIKLYKEIVNF